MSLAPPRTLLILTLALTAVSIELQESLAISFTVEVTDEKAIGDLWRLSSHSKHMQFDQKIPYLDSMSSPNARFTTKSPLSCLRCSTLSRPVNIQHLVGQTSFGFSLHESDRFSREKTGALSSTVNFFACMRIMKKTCE